MRNGRATTIGDPGASNPPRADAAPGAVRAGRDDITPAATATPEATTTPNAAPTPTSAPAPAPAPAPAATPGATCVNFATWYEAQTAYEAAGGLAADPALVVSLDPDYDGIACEEAMTA